MAKKIYRILDDLSPCETHLRDLPRKPSGLYNLKLNEYGQLEKRKGYSKYNTTSLSEDHKIVGMHRFYKQATTTKEFLVVCDTIVSKLAETDPWGATSIKTGLTADKETFFVDFLNHCYFVNGTDGVFKYNMTNTRTVGITVPGAPTGVSNINGSLTEGIYYYKYTFVDEDGYESNGGTTSEAITALADPNDGITLTIAASTDAKITKRRIYRTTSGGTVYYYEGEVPDNTTLTFASTTADATLAINSVLHDDHNAPPSTSHLIAKRLNRLYLAYAEKLYISHISDCEYFPSDWYIQAGNMQKISGLIEQVDTLPVFTDDSIERLVGTDEDNFEFRNAYSTNGNIAYRSEINCDNLLVYLSFEGLYYFDGVTSKELNIPLNEYIKANINETYASLSAACYFDNKYLLSYPKGESTVPNETIYYDFRTGTYGVYSFAFDCYSKWDKGNDGLKLKGGSTTIGRVYSVLTGTTDDTASITSYDSPEPIDLGKPDIWKQWFNIYIKVKSTTRTNTTVDADSAASQKVLNVTSTTGFSAGGFVVINEGGAREETKIIATVQSGISLTMTTNLTYAHTAVQADTVVTPLRFYYTLDDATETYKDLTLTADTTKWYKIDLITGGQRARALKPRPYISDAYDATIMGYAFVYDIEAPEY